MNKKSSIIYLFLLTILYSGVFAQNHTVKSKPRPKTASKTILILKDSSNLELSVSRIIKDSLTKAGYLVKETRLADIVKEKASSYNITIVFNAIKPGNEIDPRVRKFVTTKSDTISKVFIYTVYGTTFNAKDNYVDATTLATQALQPQLIANHILRSLKL